MTDKKLVEAVRRLKAAWAACHAADVEEVKKAWRDVFIALRAATPEDMRREWKPEELARDRLWCEALTRVLPADEILKVTREFNRIRPDRAFGCLIHGPPTPDKPEAQGDDRYQRALEALRNLYYPADAWNQWAIWPNDSDYGKTIHRKLDAALAAAGKVLGGGE